MSHISKAQICNLALAHIKQTTTTIANLDTDTGGVAAQCRIHYDVARRFVLADHNWNFATKRVTLADIGSPPADWAYRYDYPSDCLKFRKIVRLDKADDPIPFEVMSENDGSGTSIVTDLIQAVGEYTFDLENVALFSPGLVSSLGWYLASELAPALSGSAKIQQACLTVYRNIGAAAETQDSNEGSPDPDFDAPWDRARI